MRRSVLATAVLAVLACSDKKQPAPVPTPVPVAPTDAAAPAPPPTVDAAAAKAPMPEVANAGPGFLYVKGKDYEGVISSGGGPWTPSPQDVADLEAVLVPAIAAHALGKAQPGSELKRQYYGVDLDGKQVIRVQLACRVDANWQTKGLPSVKGGGACYGLADFDLASGTLTRLDANASK